jgi:predicted amidophosphoribosyltransferase
MHAVPVPGVDECLALVTYEGPGRRLVTDLKYRNDRRSLGAVAGAMAGLLNPPLPVVVTWIPTTAARRHRRGYDQAALLARALARRWGRPCRPLLARRPGPAQTGRSRTDRNQGIPLLVRSRGPVSFPVVLVDDVITTGASVRSAAAVLRAAGAPWIGAVAIARTPRGQS